MISFITKKKRERNRSQTNIIAYLNAEGTHTMKRRKDQQTEKVFAEINIQGRHETWS